MTEGLVTEGLVKEELATEGLASFVTDGKLIKVLVGLETERVFLGH